MAKGFWVKASPTGNFKTITGFFVKVSPSTWQSVNDAWVKVKQTGTDAFQRFWESPTNPVTPIEILTSFTTTTEQLRLQGKNYRWSPTPSTLFYTFTYVDNMTATTYTLTSSTSTSNPLSGSSITVPSSTTYRSISRNASDNEFAVGGLSTYKFTVTGTTSSGASSVQTAEYSMRTPAAPTITTEVLSGTSVKLTITAASTADYSATYRYIVYTSDDVGGIIESGGGRGGYAADSDPKIVTLTGLTAGRTYDVYVAPFTGSTGSTTANAAGYPGAEGYVSVQPVSDYTFTFGKVLHVGTNGYISLDSGNTVDAISSTTGKVLGILPGDLYQDTTTSVWYWSDETKFIIRWEGYHYNQPANLRQYEVTFTKDTNYVTVYPINVANTSEGTEAYVKNGVALTSYAAALGTGSWRTVYFDPTLSPANLFGPYVPKSKSVMKQVTGLTAGNQDQGYTSITTSINQNVTPTLGAFDVSSFTKGTVAASSQGAARSTTLTWGSSTNATRYEIQYQGSNDNTNWTTVQTYGQSAYNTGTTETKTWSSQAGGDFTFYTFMRANIRASESTATAAYVYSNNSAYVTASGVAPGQPTFGTITTTGSTASVPFTVGTAGTNFLYTSIEYMYRASTGSYPATWSTSTITNGAGTISLTGLSASTTYYIKIRTRNYDELYSAENETTLATSATPGAFTTISFTKAKASGSTRSLSLSWNASTNGPNYEVQYEGSSNGTTWTVLQSFNASSYKTLTSDTYSATEYKFYRASVRARNSNKDFDSAAYSDGGTSSSYVYISATGTSPGQPTIGVITVGTTTASAAYTHPTDTGSSTIDWIQFSLDASTWYNDYTSPFADNPPLGGLTANTDYTLYARALNYDGLYSTNTSKAFKTNALTLYTITFNSKGGDAVSSKSQTTEGGSISQPTNPGKTDYTFGGWSTSDGGTTAVTWPRTPTGNETLYAIWTAVSTLYTVTFNVNSASGSPSVNSVAQTTSGGSVTLASIGTMSSSGNIFGGWRTGTTSGTVYAFGASYTPTANVTLYAYYGATPTCGTPYAYFSRFPNDNSSSWEYYADYSTPSGAYTSIHSIQFEIYTTQTGSTLIAGGSGSLAYPGASSYPYTSSRLGNDWQFRVASGSGSRVATTSARWGRFRVRMTGIDGTLYNGDWTSRF